MPAKETESPFPGARIVRLGSTTSTMDEARALAAAGAARGSAVVADRQTRGRGRVPGRSWAGEPGASLLCTVILDSGDLSGGGFPLRVGLALLRTIETLVPAARDRLALKWPNDVVVAYPRRAPTGDDGPSAKGADSAAPGARKLAGILCEGSGGRVLAGVGVNLLRQPWPGGCKLPPVSVEEAFHPADPSAVPSRDSVLLEFLGQLGSAISEEEALAEVGRRLYARGKRVRFVPGLPGSEPVEGCVEGLDHSGSLRIRLAAGSVVTFASGELDFG
ncbi:MAG: biotin--[acetyl-CoA-carboxylase] ligase [Spirochaetales bacterium]|nr:biotin--[acetyl-CoA-carboxylase] ligase [Spirochaetales bacterium]